ncbi:MAG: adenylate/guanylate cyclase domain-containing protein [Pseudomonadota bacterium]
MTNPVSDFLRRRTLTPGDVDDPRFAFSRFFLNFVDDAVEQEYQDYRNPKIANTLRGLLAIAALLLFAGSLIDHSRENQAMAMELTMIRAVVFVGLLGALWLTWRPEIQANLQGFITLGATATHVVWWVTLLLVEEKIASYDGVLQLNILLTFLVSGLMFKRACKVALGATAAYVAGLLLYHPDAMKPILYLVITVVYAGFAAFVAERARREAWAESQALAEERARSDRLLLNVLPRSIADRKKQDETAIIADDFDDAAVLFADIVGFTQMSARMTPGDLVKILDDIFSRFDRIAEELDLEKIKTIGDCYMLACGLPRERHCDVWKIGEAALRMQQELAAVAASIPEDKIAPEGLQIRIGIHCGPVVAGVIGESKYIYDLWGDTVNVASRMESTGEPGKIQISAAMRERLSDRFAIGHRGLVPMKGKDVQEVWLLEGRLT